MTVGELLDELDGLDPGLEVVATDYTGRAVIEYGLLDSLAVIDGKVRIETGEQKVVSR